MSSFISREVEHLVPGQPASDGAGVRLLRVLSGAGWQRRLDPFLMLDEFRSDQPGDYLAGFPEHPHRGFQTVTYMLAGRMRHRDSVGHEGVIGPGAVQWMNAGRGIRVELEEHVSSEVAQAVAENVADVGVVSDLSDFDGVALHPCWRDQLALLAPAGHPLAHARACALPRRWNTRWWASSPAALCTAGYCAPPPNWAAACPCKCRWAALTPCAP